jgi:hypothetical protein
MMVDPVSLAASPLATMLVQSIVDSRRDARRVKGISRSVRADLYSHFQRQATLVTSDAVRFVTMIETPFTSSLRSAAGPTGVLVTAELSRSPRFGDHADRMSAVILFYGLANHLSDLVVGRELRLAVTGAQDRIVELIARYDDIRLMAAPAVHEAANNVLGEIANLFAAIPTRKPNKLFRSLSPALESKWAHSRVDFDERLRASGVAACAFRTAAEADLLVRRFGRRRRRAT